VEAQVIAQLATAVGTIITAVYGRKTRKQTKPSNGKTLTRTVEDIADDVRFTKNHLIAHITDKKAHK